MDSRLSNDEIDELLNEYGSGSEMDDSDLDPDFHVYSDEHDSESDEVEEEDDQVAVAGTSGAREIDSDSENSDDFFIQPRNTEPSAPLQQAESSTSAVPSRIRVASPEDIQWTDPIGRQKEFEFWNK